MVIDLEEQKKRVELQKKKIQLREKLLKEKEKQKKAKRIGEIVEMAFRKNLEQMDDTVLLGAFLEISKELENPLAIMRWKNNGELYKQAQIAEQPARLIAISFENEPTKEIKALLKKLKFRWNPFRKEFCGLGQQQEMESLLKEWSFSIEILNA